MATAAARTGRGNEDFVGVVPTAIVLVDGAGGVSGAELVCRHGPAWYARRLGVELLGLLSSDTNRPVPALLAEAIVQVADAHGPGCDLADPRSPWASVAILRLRDGHADHLVLGDSFLVLDRAGDSAGARAPLVVSDPREVTLARPYRSALAAAVEGSAEYEQVRRDGIAVLRANRNRPGGYWVAKEDPRAAAEAVIGSCPVSELTGAVLLSNGASRIVDRFRLAGWPEVLAMLASSGPAAIIRRVRQAEAQQAVAADDATVAYCTDLAEGPAASVPGSGSCAVAAP
ncbi:hypothetical protein ABNF97_11025 [Plantactinospora sp. B6F1]|uniref:hypothetical protein n=1 Tax=Plantactinospora sp. B6F1 TaxID=3158971 RepID=UPI0032D9368F